MFRAGRARWGAVQRNNWLQRRDNMLQNKNTRAGLAGRVMAGLLVMLVGLGLSLGAAQAKEIKLGIVTFLSGAAAGPFGIPARNGAEMIIDAINSGKMPAPYASSGMAGMTIVPVIIDEAGGTTKQVAEFRNLVQRQNVDAVVGYISSGSCLGIAPAAEELKKITVLFDCGTPRIFEDADYKYVFRTISHATMDNVAAVRYLKAKFPNVKAYGAINQNYAWGQDSWRDFNATMQLLYKGSKVTSEQFPKIFAGQYNSEISALLVSKSDVIHSSLWGGDLESFLFQAGARGLHKRAKLVLTTGESSMFRMGAKMPDGVIIGGRGPYGVLAKDTPLNQWFRNEYTNRYGTPPGYPAYQMAQAILGLKVAYDKAAQGGSTSDDAVIKAFEYSKFEAFGTTVDMKLGKGHQAVTGTAYGIYKFDRSKGEATISDVLHFNADCVNPPEGVKSIDWINSGLKGAKCD